MGRKGKRNPVTYTTPTHEAAELRARRASVMRQVQRLEWDFDRHPTSELANELATLRGELCDMEQEIAEVFADAELRKEIRNSVIVLEKLSEAGTE